MWNDRGDSSGGPCALKAVEATRADSGLSDGKTGRRWGWALAMPPRALSWVISATHRGAHRSGGAPFVPKSPLWEIPLRSVVQCATGQPHAWVPVSAGARPGQGAWKIVLGPGELGAQGRVVLSFLSPLCPVTLRAQARSVPLATCARGTHRCPLPCRVPPSLLEGPSEPGPLTRAIPIGLVSFHLNLARFYCHLSGLTSLGGRLPRLVPIMQSSACWINFLFRIDSSFLHK